MPPWKRVLGIALIIIGFLALIMPLTPGSWLIFVGAEILGIQALQEKRVKALASILWSRYQRPLRFAIPTAAALAVGGIGAIFTTPEIHTWYAALTQPSWTPPNWVFGPVWTTLYILMGIAAGIIWQCGAGKRRHDALALYSGQLVFNLAWSIVFFGLHSIVGGLIIILILALMIVALMMQASHISKKVVWLLVPYILWVCYAASLNLGIYFLN